MLKWIKGNALEKFAIDLATQFSARCPPARMAGGSQGVIGLARAVDEVCNRAASFQRKEKLGVYGRAKLGTEFKMQLRELGYPEDFVDELVGKVLISMSAR